MKQDRAVEKVHTLVIGGGQAGIAMSENLTARGVPHLVVEKNRIAESWRTARWDSLVANGPAWHDRFPSMEFDSDPDGFPGKDEVAAYFENYARKINAPIRTGVTVTSLQKRGDHFRVETTSGEIEALQVVVATGPFQTPHIPTIVPDTAGVMQLHSRHYKNPQQLPEGAVLVVGCGSSGAQISNELLRSGRKVFLSIGPHNRPPRAYRGVDYCWWLGKLGIWDLKVPRPGTEHVTIAVSGAQGGHTVDFRAMAHRGMILLGMAKNFSDGALLIADDLKANLDRGDADYLSVLDGADALAAEQGWDMPLEPEARLMLPDPFCVTDPVLRLDFAKENITSIIWATGYALDFSWIKADIFDEKGRPKHDRGVSVVPGLYFLGLPWLSRRASSFIFGVWKDAEFLASHIRP